MFIEGRNLKYDVPPVIKEGRTLVPIRAISEGLGAEVDWIPETREVVIKKDGKIIRLKIDSTIVYVDGLPNTIDVPAELVNQRTLVPLRIISEGLGVSVDYNEETGDIDIGLFKH